MENPPIFKEEFIQKQIVVEDDPQIFLLFPDYEEPKKTFKVLTEDKIAS